MNNCETRANNVSNDDVIYDHGLIFWPNGIICSTLHWTFDNVSSIWKKTHLDPSKSAKSQGPILNRIRHIDLHHSSPWPWRDLLSQSRQRGVECSEDFAMTGGCTCNSINLILVSPGGSTSIELRCAYYQVSVMHCVQLIAKYCVDTWPWWARIISNHTVSRRSTRQVRFW
jgi:hypothetical protein